MSIVVCECQCGMLCCCDLIVVEIDFFRECWLGWVEFVVFLGVKIEVWIIEVDIKFVEECCEFLVVG